MRETLYSRVLKAHIDEEQEAKDNKLARCTRARCFESLRSSRGAPRAGGGRTVPMPLLYQHPHDEVDLRRNRRSQWPATTVPLFMNTYSALPTVKPMVSLHLCSNARMIATPNTGKRLVPPLRPIPRVQQPRFMSERHLGRELQEEAVSMSSVMLRQQGHATYYKQTGLTKMPTTDDQVRQLWKSVLMNKGDQLWPETTDFDHPEQKKANLMKIVNQYR